MSADRDTTVLQFAPSIARTVRPIRDVLAVQPLEAPALSTNTFIPDTAREKPQLATVVAIGADVRSVCVGSTVAHHRHAGVELTVDGVPYLMLREADVLAVIVEP